MSGNTGFSVLIHHLIEIAICFISGKVHMHRGAGSSAETTSQRALRAEVMPSVLGWQVGDEGKSVSQSRIATQPLYIELDLISSPQPRRQAVKQTICFPQRKSLSESTKKT